MIPCIHALAMATLSSIPPQGDPIYVLSKFGAGAELVTLDPVTGGIVNFVPITNDETLNCGITWDGHDLWSIDGSNYNGVPDRLFRISVPSGTGTVIADLAFDGGWKSIEFDRVRNQYFIIRHDGSYNSLYAVDPVTASLTLIAQLATLGFEPISAFAVNGSGLCFAVEVRASTQGLYRIDLGDGSTQFLGTLPVGGNWSHFWDLSFDCSDQLWGVLSVGGVYRIDPATMTASIGLPNSQNYGGIAFHRSCDIIPYCTNKITSNNCVPDIFAWGIPSASGSGTFMVECSDAINQKSGLLFYGNSGRHAASFQGGTLCVKAPLRRTPATQSGGSPPPAMDCTGNFQIDMNAFATGALGGNPAPFLLIAGTTVNCQWWGRDPGFAPPYNSMLSAGLEYLIGP